jgi:hypothetical protein
VVEEDRSGGGRMRGGEVKIRGREKVTVGNEGRVERR